MPRFPRRQIREPKGFPLSIPRLAIRRRAIRRRATLAILFLVSGSPAAAQRLPIHTYNITDGLAHDSINRIVRDSRGFLWFCTNDGLSRFDGRRFTTYGKSHGLPVSRINDLLEDRTGGYWISSTDGGVLFFEPMGSKPGLTAHRFTTYEGVPRGLADRLLQDRHGRIWVSSISGLFRADRERRLFQPVDLLTPALAAAIQQTPEVGPVLEAADGSLWLGTNFGLLRRFEDGRVFHYPVLARRDEYVPALLIDRQGLLWAANPNGLLVLFPEPAESLDAERHQAPRAKSCRVPGAAGTDNSGPARIELPTSPGQLCQLTPADGLGASGVRALHQDRDGRIWIGTRGGGLSVLDQNRLRTYQERHGVDSRISSVAEDVRGNLWLGTRSRGAMRIAHGGLISYREADGLGTPNVVFIFESMAGELIVLSNHWTLNRFNGEGFDAFQPRLPDELVSASAGLWWIIQDHAGEWWVATGDGLYRFPASTVEDLPSKPPLAVYDATSGLAHDNVNRLFEDSRGDIWISSYFQPVELVRWQRSTDTFHRYGEADGLPADNWANVFAQDAAGDLWLGFHNGGLARRQGERFELYGDADGVPRGMIQGLYLDRLDSLWVASGAGGASHIETLAETLTGGRPRFVPGRRGAADSSDNHYSFTEDAKHLYIGTISGLYRRHRHSGKIRRYTTADGLASNEVRVAFRDRGGSLWFGTPDGVSRLEPAEEQAPPPDIWIDRLRIAGVEQALDELGAEAVGPIMLGHRQRRIEVGFFGLDFGPGGGLRYQYRFAGPQEGWSEPSEQNVLSANLAAGDYRLEIRALRDDGSASAAPATLTLSVAGPVWRRPWFVALVACLALALLAALYRLRVARLLELERVRIRIATDLHDDIGAGLSRIAILSEVAKQQTAAELVEPRRLLGEIADSARQLVEGMSDIVWSIDPRKDRLGDLVARVRGFAADLMGPAGIRWQLDTDSEPSAVLLQPEQRRHLLLIFKESIHNIVKHAAADRVTMSLALARGDLRLEVRDNGRGFDPEAQAGEHEVGYGLRNLKARATALGGSAVVESGPGRGTRWLIRIPVRMPSAGQRHPTEVR